MCEECNALKIQNHGYFDSCMCKDCNRFTGILTAGTHYFDSCMREDCNRERTFTVWWTMGFNSCMREDCNVTELPGGSWTAYFDSCMCEDCNGVVYQPLSVCHAISIHACARIATQIVL